MSAWIEREGELEGDLARGALWAVTYGDLMSYLTIFFLLLYASVVSKSVSLQMSLQGVQESFGKDTKVMETLFSQHGIQQIAKLEVSEDRIRIVFNAPVLFDMGSADMKPDSLPHLGRLAQALAEMPNPVQIEGHTDNIPLGKNLPFTSNWELSAARAFAVLRFFEQNQVPSGRLSAIGYGEFRPIKDNDTLEGRAANRRIEINILRQKA